MIIGIDGNEANVTRRVGIGEYAFELLQHLKETQGEKNQYQVYLKGEPLSHMPSSSAQWQYRIIKPVKLWTQIGLPFDLYTHRPRPDVFFTPTHYAPRFSPVPTVISIMDMSFFYFPQLFNKKDLHQLKSWTAYSAKNAAKIVTISKASKHDIMKLYNIPSEKIVVTYPGIKGKEGKHISMESLKEKHSLDKPYILFVGTLQPRKNITRLIEAFSMLRNPEVDLVIVGKKGWLYEEILVAPEKFHVRDNVKFLEFIEDDELASLYKQAEFFILPSLYEGFGLPVLEAMQQGCPVITSNVSSLPEVGGDAALYVDPENTSDIKEKMEKLLTDKTLQKDLIEKGKKQVKKFSWEKTAQETLAVLQQVGGKA